MSWYPRRTSYYRPVGEGDEIEQGDIFWGVPILRASHPAIADRFLPPGRRPAPEELDPPPLSDVLRGVRVHDDLVMVLPHTCDFFEPEIRTDPLRSPGGPHTADPGQRDRPTGPAPIRRRVWEYVLRACA